MEPKSFLIDNLDESRKIIRFFLSKVVDQEYFELIKQKLSKPGQNEAETARIKLGMFSPIDYGKVEKSYKRIVMNTVLRVMVENGFLSPIGAMLDFRCTYTIDPRYVTRLFNLGMLENRIFGFEYIITQYRKSVFKIENIDKKGSHDIGTGFLMNLEGRPMIITNFHVIENAKSLNLFDVDDNSFTFEIFKFDRNCDLAILEIVIKKENKESFFEEHQPFLIMNTIRPLKEIITIGYPSVPMTKDSYQLYHKGEINSLVEDYKGNKLFIISAKTSSGNSGSPVIDKSGVVLGVITQELFEKDALITKGKLPYYAVIPTSSISNLLRRK